MPKKKKKRLVLGRGNRSKTVILRAYVRQDLKIFQIQFHVFYQPEEGQFGWKRERGAMRFMLLTLIVSLWLFLSLDHQWAVYVPLTKHMATPGQAIRLLSISSNRTWAQWGQGLSLLLLSDFQSLISKCLLNLHISMIPASVTITESQMRAWVRMLDALRIQDRVLRQLSYM